MSKNINSHSVLPSTYHRELITDWKEDFFTQPEIIETCADIANEYIDNYLSNNKLDLIYVDCSAGKNQFAPLLDIPYIAIDLHKYPQSQGSIIYQDWLTVTKNQFNLPKNTKIALGLNPPFGKRYHLLNAFMDHAFQQFEPQFIFLICPEKYTLSKNINQWYDLKYQIILPHFSFYRPNNNTNFDFPSDFRIYEKRKSPIINIKTEKVPNHPLVTTCKVCDLDDPDNVQFPTKTLFIRRWGRSAGRNTFECNKDGSVSEFKDMKYLNTFPSWSNRNLSGKMFYCLIFHKKINREWFRSRFLQEWQKECPRMFIPGNDFNFDLSKNTLLKIIHKIL